MVDTPQWRGALAELDPCFWYAPERLPDFLSEEAVAWIDWMVRSRYVGLRGFAANGGSRSVNTIQLMFYWSEPLHTVFDSAIPPVPERVDRIVDRLIERADPGVYRYSPPEPGRIAGIRHTNVLPDPDFRYQMEFTISKPKLPARPRSMIWLSRRMRMEFKKLGFEHQWPATAMIAFERWLEIDGKDIWIPRRRDMEQKPLQRRLIVRSKNDKETNDSSGLVDSVRTHEPVLHKRRRIRIVRKPD